MKKSGLLSLTTILLLSSCSMQEIQGYINNLFNKESDNESEIESNNKQESIKESDSNKEKSDFTIIESDYMFVECMPYKVIDIHTDLQKQCINDIYDAALKYVQGRKHLSAPKPVELTWSLIDDPEFEYIDLFSGFTVRFSDDPELNNCQTYTVSKSVTSCYVTNLFVNHTYYYDVTANFGNVGVRSEIGSFKTANTLPRNVEIDGITNCRDIGGWSTIDGKVVKQGMVYRTARLNGDGINITEKGKKTFAEELGIKYELDYRLPGDTGNITKSPAGNSVNYVWLPMQWVYETYDSFYCDENAVAIKKTFELLADESNYPISYHCSIGTDRTGEISFLLLALLNVKESDMWRDYMFSNFGQIGSSTFEGRTKTRGEEHFGNKLAAENGSTLQEKARTVLKKVGLTDEKLDKIIEILTESN